jgi:hypothetical protein
MNVNDIYTGKNYVYKKPKARHGLLVEAIATDASHNMVLVLNLNTNKTLRVNAENLSPLRTKKELPQ